MLTENKYIYSLLKYRHSAFLGESVNVGALVYFNNDNTFHFLCNSRLTRLKSIYNQFPEKILKSYFKEISLRAYHINKKIDKFLLFEINKSFDSFLNDYFLPYDGSSLQFEKCIINNQYQNDNDKIINYLNNAYLFENSDLKVDKEYELGKKFYKKVRKHVLEAGRSNTPNFFKDYKVKNKTGVEFNFKYAWQNGSLNLVKPLNFDLSEPRYIANKAHLTYGLLVDLEDIAIHKNLKYDLLLGTPTKKSLFKEYDHSKRLLSQLNRINLIEEDSIEDYSKHLIESIST